MAKESTGFPSVVYVLDKISHITDSIVSAAAEALPEYRLQKARKYLYEKDRRSSILAFWLLQCALREHCQITVLPDIAVTKTGKPFFMDSSIHFNISHSADCVCCGISSCEIGVDIENYVKQYDDLLNYTMTHEERMLIQKTPEPCEQFTRLWTLKESYFKCTSQGLTGSLTALNFADCPGSIFSKYSHFFTTVSMEDCCLSVCTIQPHPLIIHRTAQEYLNHFTDPSL